MLIRFVPDWATLRECHALITLRTIIDDKAITIAMFLCLIDDY